MKIGILRETKNPPDRRVPFTPLQCKELIESNPGLRLVVQPSEYRCFTNEEYQSSGIVLQEDLSDCDLLMGVKEVKIPSLIAGKKYLFFSHTAKEQPYNRELLQEVVKRKISLMDYEYLTRSDRSRVVAFGRWAGIVGAYNGIKAYGQRLNLFSLKPARDLSGLEEMMGVLKGLNMNGVRIVLTGGGRVAGGAVEVLEAAGFKAEDPSDYLNSFSEKVYCRLDPWHYTRHKDGVAFDFSDFVEHPSDYRNAFLPYAEKTDLFMACHFWDPNSPVLLSKDDLKKKNISIKVIADISCDIDGPIASTVRASTIAEPVYGYDPNIGGETIDPYDERAITVMAVDNLPGELPRDASEDFGEALMKNVIPAFLNNDKDGVLKRSMITKDGHLTELFSYLDNYLKV